MYARDEPAFKAHLYRHHLSGAIVTRFRGMARKVPAFHFILWYVGMRANARSFTLVVPHYEGKAHRGRHVLVHHARTEEEGEQCKGARSAACSLPRSSLNLQWCMQSCQCMRE